MSADAGTHAMAENRPSSTTDVDNALVLSNALHAEKVDASAATIFLSDSRARIRISRKLYDYVLKFETPRTILEAADGAAPVVLALQSLAASGFLVSRNERETKPSARLATDPPIRLFDCPSRKLGGAPCHVTVLGVPYDFGDHNAAGARDGPAALREMSLQLLYRTHELTGRPKGWYDADRSRHMLDGVAIGDCGDAYVRHGEPQNDLFERVGTFVVDAVEGEALPVILGGDATVGFPAVRALAARHTLAVVRVGRPCAGSAPSSSDFVTAERLTARLNALANVHSVLTCGSKTVGTVAAQATARGSHAWSAFEDVITALPPAIPVYLSFDMEEIANSTGGRTGINYGSLCHLIQRIGRHHRICGIDIVGLNPRRNDWGVVAMTALYVLMQAMSAAVDPASTERAA